ncbi:MAG: murein L,D-transpeptidase catalytic domain family protein, partial [Chryseobacterium sp.]|nr:murein L,D-transpeptidase catalytic domain family protein [Chryseobacterium sp.]
EATYTGNNGYSLRLMGVDKGFNDAALQRSIVMHGADYVSENFAAAHKRIGRSWGCPAVSRDLAEPIINTIKGKNCLFIYYPDNNYLKSSEWLKS